MKDSEFIQIRNRYLSAFFVTLLFVVPMFIFIINSFGDKKTEILTNLKQEKSMVVFLTSNSCNRCSEVENVLFDNNVAYFELNIDENADYKEIMMHLDISKKYVEVPGIVYVEKGKTVSNLMDISVSDTQSFLNSYSLSDTIKEGEVQWEN